MKEPGILENRWIEGLRTFEGREQLLKWAYAYLRTETSLRNIAKLNRERILGLLELVKGGSSHEASARLVLNEMSRITEEPSHPLDAFKGGRHEYAARAAYDFFAGLYADWDNLADKEKFLWYGVAQAATGAYPAPVHGTIKIHLPSNMSEGIVRHVACDTTEESIHAECVDLEKWLLELTRSWRPLKIDP